MSICYLAWVLGTDSRSSEASVVCARLSCHSKGGHDKGKWLREKVGNAPLNGGRPAGAATGGLQGSGHATIPSGCIQYKNGVGCGWNSVADFLPYTCEAPVQSLVLGKACMISVGVT